MTNFELTEENQSLRQELEDKEFITLVLAKSLDEIICERDFLREINSEKSERIEELEQVNNRLNEQVEENIIIALPIKNN